MSQDSFPHLVPLSTLQHSLHRQLYPFDFLDNFQSSPFLALTLMSMPPSSPKTSAPSSPSRTQSGESTSTSEEPAPALGHQCQWVGCDKALPDPETLYLHLCNDHIGRKSTGNLCLTCKWKDCGTTCAKRDHITSHLRVHTPLKPHVCDICKKPFKRPQDLKKHEKIHTEEHHAQHKHSKAITVADPGYSTRVRGADDKPRSLGPLSHPHVPIARAKSSSVSLSESSSGAGFGVLPTPSPELDYSPEVADHGSRMYRAHQQLPTWEVLSEDVPARVAPVSGAKRSYDYGMDDFFADVKKRRVAPSYDPNMALRLSNLAYQQSLANATNGAPPAGPIPQGSAFPPRSVSFDIRTPEELAAVNDFLITLGRDVSAGGVHTSRHQQHSQSVPHSAAEEASFFDPANLAQLGIAGISGISSASAPGSGANYHGDSGFVPLSEFSHHGPSYPTRPSQQLQPVQLGLYPSPQDVQGVPYPSNRTSAHRGSVAEEHFLPLTRSPPFTPHMYAPQAYSHYVTNPFGLGTNVNVNPGASPLSSHSGMSTPPSATPPHASLPMAPDSTAAFDYLRTGRAPPPVVQLSPFEPSTKHMRTVVPLKSAGPQPSSSISSNVLARRPEPVEPKLGAGAVRRGLPAKLTASAVSSFSSSSSSIAHNRENPLYPLLTSGDEQLKLPPLTGCFRSPSPSLASSGSSSVPSREPTVSPTLSSASAEHRSPSPVTQDSPTPFPRHAVASAPRSPPPSASGSPPQTERTYPVLPPISSFGSYSREARTHPEELAHGVRQMELNGDRTMSPEERRRHASLIRELLVAINAEYRRVHGTPPPPPTGRVTAEREASDVEMISA